MTIKEEYKYSDITEKIIGCAMKVHRRMKNGFQEELTDTHFAQALNYLETLNLEIKRIINNKYKQSFQSDKSA